MKAGEEILCKFCGRDSFLVKKSLMDGWTRKGEILVCSACGEKVADMQPEASGTCQERKSALMSFLETDEEKKLEITATEDEKRFCRDCENFISHPFLSRCELHGKNVEPMDDCPDYRKKKGA